MKRKSFSRLMSLALSATLAVTSALTGGPALDVKAASTANKLTFTFQGGTGTDAFPEGATAPTKDEVNLAPPKGAGASLAGLYKFDPGQELHLASYYGEYDYDEPEFQYWTESDGIFTEFTPICGEDLSNYVTSSDDGESYKPQTGYYIPEYADREYYTYPQLIDNSTLKKSTNVSGTWTIDVSRWEDTEATGGGYYFTRNEQGVYTQVSIEYGIDVSGMELYYMSSSEGTFVENHIYDLDDFNDGTIYYTKTPQDIDEDLVTYTPVQAQLGSPLWNYLTLRDDGVVFIPTSVDFHYRDGLEEEKFYAKPEGPVDKTNWATSTWLDGFYDFDKGQPLTGGAYESGTYYEYDEDEKTLTPKTFSVSEGNAAITEETLPAVPEKAGYEGKWTFTAPEGVTWDEENQKISFSSDFLDGKYDTGYEAVFTAVYTPVDTPVQEKTISFELNYEGAPAPETRTVQVGDKLTKPAKDPKREGYTFAGWYKEAICTNEWDFATDTVTEDTTAIYARWSIEEGSVYYDVTYKVDGEIYQTMSVEDLTLVSSNMPAKPSKTGYTFEYWYKDNPDEAFDLSTLVTDNTLVLNAKFKPIKYYISFVDNNKDVKGTMADLELTYDDFTKKIPECTYTRDHYTFSMWEMLVGYDKQGYPEYKYYHTGDTITENLASVDGAIVKFYSCWQGAGPYTIEYYDVDKNKIDLTQEEYQYVQKEIYYGNTFQNAYNWYGVLTGYKFDGWYTMDKDRQVTYDTRLDWIPTESVIKLYMKRSPVTLKVTYNSNLSGVKSETVTYKGDEEHFQEKKFKVKENVFTGIDDDQAGKFVKWVSDTKVYEEDPDTGSWNYVPLEFAKTDEMYVRTILNKLTEYTSSTASSYAVNLYAYWEPTEEEKASYTVDFVIKDSIATYSTDYDRDIQAFSYEPNAANPTAYIHKEAVGVKENLILSGNEVIRKGYKLTGWYDPSTKKTYKPTQTLTALAPKDGTVTLEAQFAKTEDSYKVTYQLNGGKYDNGKEKLPASYKYSAPQSLAAGSNYYDKMVRTGYSFAGWFLDPEFNTPVNGLGKGNTVETGAAILYAKWIPATYSVKLTGLKSAKLNDFELDPAAEGVYELPALVEYGQVIDLSKYIVTKTGYKFNKWEYTVNGKKVQKKATDKIKDLATSGTVEIKATFTPVKYKVTFDYNGGKLAAKTKQPATTYVTADGYNVAGGLTGIKIPVREGYFFVGYEVTKNADTVTITNPYSEVLPYKVTSTEITGASYGDVILQAQWEPMFYNIDFYNGANELGFYGYVGKTYADKVFLNNAAKDIDNDVEVALQKSVDGFATKAGATKSALNIKTEYPINKLISSKDKNKTDPEDLNEVGTIKLYVVEGKAKQYHITYEGIDNGDYKLKKNTFTFVENTKDQALPVAIRSGYDFVKWECDTPGILTDDGLKIKGGTKQDIVIRPKFSAITYKVTVNINVSGKNKPKDGAGKEVKTYVLSNKVDYMTGIGVDPKDATKTVDFDNLPTDWTRDGYEFIGFATSAKSYEPIDSLAGLSAKKNGNAVIYAIWIPTVCEITYSNDPYVMNYTGNTELVAQAVFNDAIAKFNADDSGYQYAYFDKDLKLPTIKVPYYDFQGWMLDESQYYGDPDDLKVTAKNGIISKINKDNRAAKITLRPVFKEYTYNIKYNLGGGQYVSGYKNGKAVYKKGTVTYWTNVPYSLDVTAYVNPTRDPFSLSKKSAEFARFDLDAKGNTGWTTTDPASPAYKVSKLTNKKNGTVTVYAIWSPIKVAVPKVAKAVEVEGLDKIDVTLDTAVGTYKYVEVQVCSDNKFKVGVVDGAIASGVSTIRLNKSYGTSCYVRVREVYENRAGTSYSSWSKSVRVSKPTAIN